MKAIAYEEFGSADVLELREVRQPELERDEVLVRVRAASANPWDWHFMRGLPYIARLRGAGLRKPKNMVLGSDMAGQVEAVGNKVTRFRPGDEVFGFVGAGGFAEYVSAPEELLAWKPANLSFQQAATVPLAALTALQGLRDVGEIQAGQKVLILFTGQTMRPLVTKRSREDLQFLRELIEAGRVTPVIDRTCPLSESADAIRCLETGRARGEVVISV